ncbi:MAG: hypothetical protein GY760_00560 [Deltaproteobacteria bacterium]|nr:hypothetical protein [Deltaproteobacteria bacterium]
MKIENACHEDTGENGTKIVSKLYCSLAGKSQEMEILSGTLAFKAYNKNTIVEKFQCNYGLNDKFQNDLNDGKLKITGVDKDRNARVIEIPDHPFFLATLFLPQLNSDNNSPHPLIMSFIKSLKE